MMRAWENRSDTVVVDEPLYAHFLDHTGFDHPMREEIIAAGDTQWQRVTAQMSQPPEQGIYYQKHITTHWLEHFSYDWLDSLEHVFLIREPEPVVASYSIKRAGLTAMDLGYLQQAKLFTHISERQDQQPLVIDSKRFLMDPESQLHSICSTLGIAFEPNMLAWPQGARPSDGVWGAHWYDAVIQSTGFAPPRPKAIQLTEQEQLIADTCRPYYELLAKHAL